MAKLKARMDIVRYANCWEDPSLLVEGLQPSRSEKLLSICSSGDNALTLLAAGAANVVAFDVNPAQLACLGLRLAALRELAYPNLLEFLGASSSIDSNTDEVKFRRLETWKSIRRFADPATREFWDEHPQDIARGALHAGRFEEFFRTFRKRVLPLVHGSRDIADLLEAKDRASRENFFGRTWNNRRWRFLFSLAFSRWSLGRLGRDPSFFDHVRGPVAARIAERTRHALVELPTHDNPWLSYILEGSFARALPPWLQPRSVEILRDRLDAIRPLLGDLEEASRHGTFQGANLSDIFEYMDPLQTMESAQILSNSLLPGASVAYWNLLAPRSLARSAPHLFRPEDERARTLHARDRAWFYGSFHLDSHWKSR
ncbi:MAG: DUF3419 family protein [Fibrobacteres bacterium]|nr:DUF3419 family protein [Fibrobacterota bacterium]